MRMYGNAMAVPSVFTELPRLSMTPTQDISPSSIPWQFRGAPNLFPDPKPTSKRPCRVAWMFAVVRGMGTTGTDMSLPGSAMVGGNAIGVP